MKKFWFQIVILTIVIFAALGVAYNPAVQGLVFPALNIPGRVGNRTILTGNNSKIQIINRSQELPVLKSLLSIEVADTAQERAEGLGGRDKIASESGMLFIFDKSDNYRFWMKGLKFPLDIIWISGNTIAGILTDVPAPAPVTPDSSLQIYTSATKIDKVLEVNAGFVRSHNVVIGDFVEDVN